MVRYPLGAHQRSKARTSVLATSEFGPLLEMSYSVLNKLASQTYGGEDDRECQRLQARPHRMKRSLAWYGRPDVQIADR
jgi:hypothetical protein